jgi:gliding motility-associated-like protein
MNKHQHSFYKLLTAAVALLALAWSTPSMATHIIGAKIRYECLGNNTYKVVMDVYRDCNPGNAPFDDPAQLAAFDDNFDYIEIYNPQLTLDLLFNDTLPNNISNDPCLLPPPNVCVERARYEGIIQLTVPGGTYLVYQRCCRNATISNIIDPLSTGSTYFVYISPESRQLCNNSPDFDFYPPIYICINKPINHDHSATDQDGDSLVYKLYTPFIGGSLTNPDPAGYQMSPPPYDTITWIDPPYNLQNVLGPSSIAELAIDPATGLITGFPEIMGQFVVGILVEEYRNGQLLSVIRRDFQYNVGECVEVDAEIVANDAQCDDLTVSFGNNTNGPDNFQWYYIHGLDTVFFSNQFEPTFTFPDTGKYEIMLIAVPGYECVDTAYHQLFLQYNSLTADFSWETYDCNNESVLVLEDLSFDPISPPNEWFWEIVFGNDTLTSTEQNPTLILPNPVSGTITLTVKSQNGCVQSKTVDFETGLNNPSDLLPDLIEICIGESAELNPNGPTNGLFTFQWAPPVPPNQQNLVNPMVTPAIPATYNYVVTITGFNDLCVSVDTVVLIVHPEVMLDFEPDTDCDAHVVHFINNSLNAPAGYVWDFGDPTTTSDVSTQANPTYTYPDYGTYTVTLMTMPGAVCADTISKTILLEEKILDAALDFDYVQCEDGELAIQFFDVSLNNQSNTTGRLWEFSGVFNGTSQLASPTIVILQEGQLTVQLTITTDEGCVDTTEQIVLDIDLTELPCLIDGEELGCLEQGITLNTCGDTSYTYLWTPSTGLSCTTCASPFANPLQTTTYTVMVQNISADTCFITRQVTVIVPDDVGLVASDDVLTCDSTVKLVASTTLLPVEYDWFNENNMLIADGPNMLTVDVSGNNSYIVRATDQFGCYYYDTIQVAGGPVDITVVGDQIICSDDPLNVFATNLDPNDTLTWLWEPTSAFSGGADTSNPDLAIVSGNQTVTVTATNQFGCDTTEAVVVDILDVNNNLDFDFEIECDGSQVSFTNLSTNAYNFLWDFGDPTTTNDVSTEVNPTYNYPYEDTFQVTLTLDFPLDCYIPITKDVIIDSAQFVVDFDFEYVECSEDSVAIQFLNNTVFSVNNIFIDSFLWELSNGLISNEENPIFTLETGDDLGVKLTIWTSNGCVGMDNAFIKFEFPNIPLADSIVLCPGDSVFLNPTGDISFTYNWFPNIAIDSTQAVNPQVWPSQTTTYTVQVTSFIPDTCTIFKDITVFVPAEINVQATADTLTCGAPVTLVASSPVTPVDYTWTATPPNAIVGTGAMVNHYPAVDTWYEVQAVDEYGCRDTAMVFVANEAIDADISGGDDDVCPQSLVQLQVTNNVPDHTLIYDWSATPPGAINSGENTATPLVLTPTAGDPSTYSVTVTNQHGCDDTLSLTLTGFEFEPTVVPSDTLCPGVPSPLNPGADPTYNYTWSPANGFNPNDPNPTVTLTESMDFTVIVSLGFGLEECADTIDVTRFVPEAIEITGVVDTFTCGSAIELTATTNVTTQIDWLNAAGDSILHTGNPFMPNPDTEETYIVNATDIFGCMEADTFNVINNELTIMLDGGGVIDTCPQPFYDICINNFDPNDILTFDWSVVSNGTINGATDSACVNISVTPVGGTATFIAAVTNQYGCTSDETAAITTYNFVPTLREFITICPDVPTAINPDAAGSNLNYLWSPSSGLDCDNCPNPIATLSQDQQYTVTITGVNAEETCIDSGSVNVLVNPYIEISTTPSPDTALCEITDVTLSASVISPITQEICWFENSLDNPIACTDEITVMPNGAVVYYAVASDTLGCKDTTQVTVNAFPINVTLDEQLIFCEEAETLTIEVVNNDPAQILTFSNWQDQQYIVGAAPDSSSVTIDDVPAETLFTVDIENQFGCTLTDSTTVLYFNIDPTVGVITSTMDSIYFNSGEFSQLDLTDFNPNYFYEWVPQDGLSDPFIHNPEAAPLETTEYVLIITNEFGCSAERVDTIFVLNPDCDEPNIFIPNAFTPNGDGSNDVLFVRSNIIENMELSIYNRWGELVFRTTDQTEGWDGHYKNQQLAPDVYGFYLRADCFNGMEFTKKGNVMILR